MSNQNIMIEVAGGTVQSVKIPKGFSVEVRNYDTDGVEMDRFDMDENGCHYILGSPEIHESEDYGV